ncbi:unnamed protein product [Hymenolepis diminuta]|uniref:Uncharacterized protein n=1 Tax=Hymenolepis diminuta TaxID=6216 RepID=A0A564ZD17_HYMDI|nr:unnamed protein product [Hymenolepis diminuta]
MLIRAITWRVSVVTCSFITRPPSSSPVSASLILVAAKKIIDSFNPPNILTKTAAQDISDTQKTLDSPQSSSQGNSNPATPYVNLYPPFPCYPYAQPLHLMPRLIPYDSATSLSQWFMSTDLLLSKYPSAVKMKTLFFALSKDIRFWLQLKCVMENSDYDYAKPPIINLMSITKSQE